MKKLVLLIVGALISWSCCSFDDDLIPIEPGTFVNVLIVDDLTNNFEGGKIYHYNEQYAKCYCLYIVVYGGCFFTEKVCF